MIKKLAVLLAVIIGITGTSVFFDTGDTYADEKPPEILAESGILIDGNSGKILYSKNENARLEPASTTKIMTCLLALENLDIEKKAHVDKEASFTEGSRIYLLEDENVTIEQVLYALMTESANDAAVVLAKEVSGSVEEFAKLMNKRARELGAKNTTFKNPHGLHQEGHMTTAYDLAMIAKGCMKNKMFRKICNTKYYNIPATNLQEERHLHNTNRLLYDTETKVPVNGVDVIAKYDGAIGIKPGYIPEAGGCLVAAAERDGTFLISVVLKSTEPGRFGDSIALLDYGFRNYHTVKVAEKGKELGIAKIKRGSVSKVDTVLDEDIYITLPKEASKGVLRTETVFYDKVKAPVKKGEAVGEYRVYEGEDLVLTRGAVAVSAVDKGTLLSAIGIGNRAAHIIYTVAGIAAGAFIILSTTYIVLKRRQIKRKKALRAKRALEIARKRAERERDIEKRDWHF